MTTTFPMPSTQKVRRDVLGGKRGDGHRRDRPIRRLDPHQTRLGAPDPTLTGVGALLRPGDTAFDEAEVPLLERWLERLRQTVGPACVIYVRIDSAGDCAEVFAAGRRSNRPLALTRRKGWLSPRLGATR